MILKMKRLMVGKNSRMMQMRNSRTIFLRKRILLKVPCLQMAVCHLIPMNQRKTAILTPTIIPAATNLI